MQGVRTLHDVELDVEDEELWRTSDLWLKIKTRSVLRGRQRRPLFAEAVEVRRLEIVMVRKPVSYTHLTLPTIYSV